VNEKAAKVATAHHLDDQVETFFIQLLRRGDIGSLTGIPVLTENRIRPLMFTNRRNIARYVQKNNIPYREDESNASDKYLRNKIRNLLIPAVENVDHSLKNKVLELMNELKEVNDIVQQYTDEWDENLLSEKDGDIYYSIAAIKKLDFSELFLEKIMRKYGFNKSVTEMLIKSLDGQSGKVFYGLSRKLIKDREHLIFTDITPSDELNYSLYKEDLPGFSNLPVDFSVDDILTIPRIDAEKEIAQLDYDKLNSHIIFRKWKDGDYFVPLGMKGRRKLSDYFIDKKMNLSEKDKQWLMLSGEEICCLIGERIDERYKITQETKTVLTIRLTK
jgi:tRNA(Ile)-lysidine synthase